MRDERAESFGEYGGIWRPVAEAGGVVPSSVEPAVVQNEPLDTQCCRGVCQATQIGQRLVEVQSFPSVQVHLAWGTGGATWQHLFQGVAMENSAQAIAALLAAMEQRFRCGIDFVRR